MPRPPRIDYLGAWHHVMNRGARHQAIFVDDADRADFLALLGSTAQRYGLEIHAYALMDNHYHVLVQSLRGRLSEAMRHLQQTWTQTINRRHDWDGPLFRGRFRSQLVENDDYLQTVLAYIHLNPVKAGLVPDAARAVWTSHPAYLGHVPRPEWLHTARLIEQIGGIKAVDAVVRSMGLLPDDLGEELVDGLAVRGPVTGQVLREVPDVVEPPEPHILLEAVETLTQTKVESLRKPQRGPDANPARRFAVWVLRRDTELSQAEVGHALNMSQREVQNVELALRRRVLPPIDAWIYSWTMRDSLDSSAQGPV